MAEINNLTNIAREIVSKLDADDKKSDGKIEASIWNKFVCNKQGNEIRNYINTDRALKSVIAYLKREAAKTGQAIEDIANEWAENLGINIDNTQIDSSRYNKTGNELSIRYIDVMSSAKPYGTDEACEEMTQNSEEWEKTKEEWANVFDDSCQLLFDVANNNYRYKITKESDELTRTITLADGRTIKIGLYKDENGKVSLCDIFIYDDKKDTCLSYEGDAIFIRTGDKKGRIGGSKKETTKDMWEIAEKIFGEDLRNSFGDDLDFYGYIGRAYKE